MRRSRCIPAEWKSTGSSGSCSSQIIAELPNRSRVTDLRIASSNTVACCHALVKIFDSTVRLTMRLRNGGGLWQVAHDHHSIHSPKSSSESRDGNVIDERDGDNINVRSQRGQFFSARRSGRSERARRWRRRSGRVVGRHLQVSGASVSVLVKQQQRDHATRGFCLHRMRRWRPANNGDVCPGRGVH
jgi:hypothetical protein